MKFRRHNPALRAQAAGGTRAFVYLLLAGSALAADSGPKPAPPPEAGAQTSAPAPASRRRTELNLLGQTDTRSGESRRNENVQFNLIDNNALKELNVRMGTTATIVEEFRVDRNYFGVEFGNPAPLPLHLAGSKTQAIHGSIYELHNNSIFSARSFFQVGGVKPARENNYGFTLGAPVWPRGFLSVDGNQQKIRGSVNGNVLVPRLDERTPLTNDLATRSIVEHFFAAYPRELPNRTDINERALNTNAPQVINTNNAGVRLDQYRKERDRFTLQYRFTTQDVDAFQLVAGQNPDTHTKAHTARFTWNRTWSAATSTDVSAGFDRLRSLLVPEPNAVGPQVSMGGVIAILGPSSSLPIDRTQNQFRYAGQILQVRGSHTWRAGFELLRRQINGRESSSHRGTLSFVNDFGRDAITNLRLGTPSRYSVGIGDVNRGFRNWDMQYYLGDSWRPRPNLSLNYGLRYQPVTRPSEVNNRNVIPYGCTCSNLAPRFGFAYRLGGRWGVLRGAYGLHYGEIFTVTFQQVRFNPPGNIKIELHNPYLADPLGGLTPAELSPDARSTTFELSPHLTSPYSHQYNFSWEPVLFGNWKLQLGYVGSRSHDLLMMWYTNRARPVPGIEQTNATVNLRRPDPAHFDIRRVLNGSRAYFDAARVSLIFPRWRRLSFDASYWLSKAIDLGANYTSPATSADSGQVRSQSEFLVQQDLKGPSAFDQSHAFLLRAAYTTPGFSARQRWLHAAIGIWDLSTVALIKTGTPFSVISGSDAPGFGNVDGSEGDRPHLLDPLILGRPINNPDTSARLLPRSAFAFILPNEARGNLGQNTFRKDGIANINAAIARSWRLGRENTLTFRAESINFFNTPQFAEPGRELTSPSFGQITNTLNDGRTFRFELRFRF